MKPVKFNHPRNKQFELAISIIKRLNSIGHKAYFAGGSVRDMYMNNDVNDIDIATGAKPEDVIKLFNKTLQVGKQFGVIIVILENIHFEVTTFRQDKEYVDGRRPEGVIFTDEKNDVLRRDFTVNGLLYDPIKMEIIDYTQGIKDIENKIIRAIGNAEKRFTEDKLRLLRCIRFAVKLGFDIEEQTYNSVKKLSPFINQVSAERISEELKKILLSPAPARGIGLLNETGLLKEILPEVYTLHGVEQPEEFHPEGDVYKHTVLMLENMNNPSFELAMAVLLHDAGKPGTYEVSDRIRFSGHEKLSAELSLDVSSRLKLSKQQRDRIYSLVLNHMKFKDVKKMRESKLKRFLRMDYFDEHLELHRLDCLASHGSVENYNFCIDKIKEYKSEQQPLKPKLLITGNDLIKMGLKPGPLFSKILTELENLQLEGKMESKSAAVNWVKANYNK